MGGAMISSDLRSIARALGGEVIGRQVVAPGPGHSPKDRSLSVTVSAAAPDGFLVFSHAGDPWQDCRDHVKSRLGIDPQQRLIRPMPRPITLPVGADDRTGHALALWHQADPRGHLVKRYLASRGLELGDDIAGEVLRWHPGIHAMLALFRDIRTDEPRAICRTFLDQDGRKIERKFLGPVGGCAIKLDADDEVAHGLHIGEGLETCMAARQLGLSPAWALGSAGVVAAFAVLARIETLTLLTERCEANARAVEQCAARWYEAGREVIIIEPKRGKDMNDSLLLGRRS
jgi:putative DNA primase/helicase